MYGRSLFRQAAPLWQAREPETRHRRAGSERSEDGFLGPERPEHAAYEPLTNPKMLAKAHVLGYPCDQWDKG